MANNFKFRPLHDRIIVERLEAEEKTSSGLYIPDSAKDKPMEGNVVASGEGKKNDDGTIVKMDVKVGDKILFGKYSGTEVKVEGKDYLIMREDDVLGVVVQ